MHSSCSFQDAVPGGPGARPAKSLPPNALGPELSCSLQDAEGGVFGHGRAAAGGSALPLPDAPSSTASDSRDAPPAISSGYRAPLGHTQDLSPASGGGNRRGGGSDTPTDRKLVVGDGTEKAERNFGSKDNDGPRSHGLLRIRNEILEENQNPVDVNKRNQKWLRDHRRKPASPGVPRKTEEDQSRRARYGNFSKAPKVTIGFWFQIRFEDRLQHQLRGSLHRS